MKISKEIGITLSVLIVLLLVLSYLGITGKVIKVSDIKIHLSSNENVLNEENLKVNRGEIVYVTIETGSKGILNRVSFAKDLGGGKSSGGQSLVLRDDNCGDAFCLRNTVVKGSYKTQADWEGRYCARVREKGSYKDIVKCFDVV